MYVSSKLNTATNVFEEIYSTTRTKHITIKPINIGATIAIKFKLVIRAVILAYKRCEYNFFMRVVSSYVLFISLFF